MANFISLHSYFDVDLILGGARPPTVMILPVSLVDLYRDVGVIYAHG